MGDYSVFLRLSGTPIYSNNGQKVVGYVDGDVFKKVARASAHMLQNPRGWAVDIGSLKAAEKAGAKVMVIYDQDTGCIYTASLSAFWTSGVFVDRGYGEQRCLPIIFWDVTYSKPKKRKPGANRRS